MPRYISAAEAVFIIFTDVVLYISEKYGRGLEFGNFSKISSSNTAAPLCQIKLSPQCHMSRNRYFSCHVMCYVEYERN